ncbi:MAG: phosphoribosylanthranilate isomerase [Actinobacteria bacterium]|nr:phosphoribosylanthranilate isomerase [Actinomycetota bacterium]
MYVKICGLSTLETVRAALDAGADAIGLVLSARSARRVSPAVAAELAGYVGAAADTVLVVDETAAHEAAGIARTAGIDILQLHGSGYGAADFARAADITPRIWRATSFADVDFPYRVGERGEETLLLDAPTPGAGERWDASVLADRTIDGPWMLAGGLTPDNVALAVAGLRPWGVDVSSGVESSRGVKDPGLIRAFVAAARSAA